MLEIIRQKKKTALKNFVSMPTVDVLSEDIAQGLVRKILFYKADTPKKGELEELAILIMAPGSMILPHQHTTNSEVYFYSGIVAVCEVGNWHSLTNTTEKDIMVVSVKTTA